VVDVLTPALRSKCMAAIRGRNTSPELKVRKIIHAMGFRYRLHCADLPGKPDIVFRKRHSIILVNGCFWHQHDFRDGRIPNSRRTYWGPKLARNVERDLQNIRKLKQMGWRVTVVWECETSDVLGLTRRISRFLSVPKRAKRKRSRAGR